MSRGQSTFAALALLLLAGVMAAACVSQQQFDKVSQDLTAVQAQIGSLSQEKAQLAAETAQLHSLLEARKVASGGGTNRKMMPDAAGKPTVDLLEVFSFDAQHAFCRIDANPKPFVMPTYSLGKVAIPANSFSMVMHATDLEAPRFVKTDDGKESVRISGRLDCWTYAGTAATTYGSKTVAEPANFEIVGVDGGAGGGAKGDSFAFTVYFDPKDAPVNYAFFGPNATFTGEMVEGEVTIATLAGLAK